MRKILMLSMALLALAGCLSVDDFGDHWTLAKLDPAFAGRWQKVQTKGEKTVEQVVFTAQDGAYDVVATTDGQPADDFTSPYPVRALTLGPYQFLVSRNRGLGGDMVRVRQEGKTLQFYTLQSDTARALQKLPNPNLNFSAYSVGIRRLDAATAAWLAAVPDTPVYWRKAVTYRRVP
jgi:hypothetical protein